METPTDMEIVRRVQTGDAEAFGELVNRYSGRIYALALAMVRDAQRAEDVTQEAFIRAYEHLDGFRGASAFGTWLYRIAYNRAAGECRRRAYDRIDAESCAVAEDRPPDGSTRRRSCGCAVRWNGFVPTSGCW